MENEFPGYTQLPASLVHGFAGADIDKIRSDGLKPRDKTGIQSRWDKHPSCEGLVYLTDMWGAFYAVQANKTKTLPRDLSLGIAEIDTAMLDHTLLRPDEDYIARKLNIQGDRTEIRKNIDSYSSEYLLSLSMMGSLA